MTKGIHPINQMNLGTSIEGHSDLTLGLTKREYFASLAMQAYIIAGVNERSGDETTANYSVMMADAMIKSLNALQV